jgi:CMP-N,N'-diacetyllegionaminic acid synthase
VNETIALIPARSGSKGVRDKNIKKLYGHSLLEWSINAALKSKLIDRVFLSTDSKKYAEMGERYGAEAPFLRPAKISGDHSTDLDFVLHALDEFKKINLHPKYLVHIRPTTPIRDPEIIDSAISLFMASNDFSSLRSVHKMSESSYKTFEITDCFLTPLPLALGEKVDSNAPRQTFPDTYQANGYVDILQTDYIIANKNIHGDQILPFITETAYEVDTIEDFYYLEYLTSKSDEIFKKIF